MKTLPHLQREEAYTAMTPGKKQSRQTTVLTVEVTRPIPCFGYENVQQIQLPGQR